MRHVRKPKIRVGDRFDGTVRDLTSAGDGVVAHPDGQVFFVPGVWTAERGEFEVTAFRGRSGSARLLTLHAAVGDRVDPPCPHHGFADADCGGCAWQFMAYAQQILAKEARVTRALADLEAGITAQPIWPSPATLGYRNRAQLKTDGRTLGFVSRGSNRIAAVNDCIVLNEANRRTLATLIARLPERSWRSGRGKNWTTLDIDDQIDAGEVTPNQRRPFRQGNSAQNERMQAWLRAQLETAAPRGPVLELFAGSGNFTEVIAEQCSVAITAVDSFAPAVQQLAQRKLPGVSTQLADLSRAGSAEAIGPALAEAELLVLDPPREGLRHSADIVARGGRLRHVIYVSCDLATFTRDCRAFQSAGFRLRELQPLDLFPHTPHIETLALLGR